MALLIDFSDVEESGLLSWKEMIESTENALRDISVYGEQANHPRRRLHCPTHSRISIHAGASMPYKLLGMMVHCELPTVTDESGRPLSKQVMKGEGDFIFVLYEAETAHLAAIIRRRRDKQQRHVDYRTAATSAVGTKLLMREGARSVALFGSGRQARSTLAALSHVMPLDRVKVFSPTTDRRRAFAVEMSRTLGVDIEPADDARSVLTGADVIVETTNTNVPVFEGRWLTEGMHVTSIAGANRELIAQLGVVRRATDDETLRRSDLIFVNLKEQMRQDQQPEISAAISQGHVTSDRVYEIGDLAARKVKGRETNSQITFYNNNAGMGVVDVTLAAYIYRLAMEHSLGSEL